ncbi:MAG: translation initiation factor IF-2 [Coriobacteriia bacterium]|nr:translation initiation factor IF-2 [Coriobacteriia bacterium]
MPGMRVHDLAKEFGLSNKEMLDKLKEMGISAKTHATPLSDENVKAVRAVFAPAEPETAEKGEAAPTPSQVAAQEAAAKRAEKEAANRAAVEAERAKREQERAEKASEEATAAEKPEKRSMFASLEDQIAAERERQAREAAQARANARAAAIARDVAKKRAVEEALAQRHGKKAGRPAPAPEPQQVQQRQQPKSIPTRTSSFSDLLSQIEQEKERIDEAKKQAVETKQQRAPKKQPKRERVRNLEPDVPELEQAPQDSSDDRYAQMAVQAEKLQRDKVLAEARAAVAAASSHEGEGRRKKRKEKRAQQAREKAVAEAERKGIDIDLVLDDSTVEVMQGSTVAEFAELLGVAPNEIIKRLFLLGSPLTLTQSMTDELIELIADDMGRKVRITTPEEEYRVVYNDTDEDLEPRPPVVTVMGHVDHGKTSLLDAIRETGVALREAGGITQHIGASVVWIDDRQITFIDTPGHAAFTAMRARGASITDIAVLVVAADDGVMPQTIESINHAKAAGVPIVVAVNKIDKPGADPTRVRQELTPYGIIPEEWGGENMFVDVSAKKRLNIDDLLETILLQADVLELRANPNALASGYVVEANLDKGRGPVATVLVNRGTLKPGDVLLAGTSYGRVRALIDPHGNRVDAAKPADPVEVLGLDSVPTAGDEFRVFEDERDARNLAKDRQLRERLKAQDTKAHMSLDDLFARIEEGKTTDLNLIVKADVQGSIEALVDAFGKMDQSEVKINVVHAAVGGITETDVTLAAASDAIIIGFNVRPTGKSKQLAEKEKVDIRLYRVIYQALEDINAARVGLLSPDIVEEDTGSAEVRETFNVPKVGTIAGCYVTSGEITRDDRVRLVRDGTVIYEGRIASLRRFKDDMKSVKEGYECGIGIDGFQDIHIGDVIEGYQMVEHERTE